MKNITAIIAAGGSGKRIGENIPKQFLLLKGREIIRWPIETFIKSGFFHEIIIPAPEEYIEYIEKIIYDYKDDIIIKVVKGGKTRAESVKNAFDISDHKTEWILIHDAARPFVSIHDLKALFLFLSDKEAVIFAKKATETVKFTEENKIKKTIDRNNIYLAQTPQIFKKSILMDAYKKISNNFINFTDEASLIEKTGLNIYIFDGKSYNIKITLPEDLKFADFIADNYFHEF